MRSRYDLHPISIGFASALHSIGPHWLTERREKMTSAIKSAIAKLSLHHRKLFFAGLILGIATVLAYTHTVSALLDT